MRNVGEKMLVGRWGEEVGVGGLGERWVDGSGGKV